MTTSPRSDTPSIARNCGEFVGHILKAIRTPVVQPNDLSQTNVQTVRAAVREEQVGAVVHRRIVIDQVVQLDSSALHH